MRQKRFLIDWLRFTVDSTERLEVFVAHYGLMEKDVSPVGFYNEAIELYGARGKMGRVDWHTEHPEQRVCFTFAGEDLDAWRADQNVYSLIAWAIFNLAKFTRVDLAIDVLEEPEADIRTLAALLKRGRAKTNARSHSIIEGNTRTSEGTTKRGVTLYVGSRQSEKFLRVYDKAAERGIEGQWVRIELECKGDYAQYLTNGLFEHGEELAVCQIRQFIDFPQVQWWTWAVNGADYDRIQVDRTPGNRQHWQNTTLLKMCADAISENKPFRAAVRAILRGYSPDDGGCADAPEAVT